MRGCPQYLHLVCILKAPVSEEGDKKDAAAVMSTLPYCQPQGLKHVSATD